MKKLSLALQTQAVSSARKEKKITQAQLAAHIGMNRSVLSRLEAGDYMPSVDQLQALAETLGFDPAELFQEAERENRSGDQDHGPRGGFQWIRQHNRRSSRCNT